MNITVINLTPAAINCHVCDGEDSAGYGIPIYEDEIVPDEYEGEWGGVPVCARCYFLVRGLQSEHPGAMLNISIVRKLVRS